MGGSHSSGLGLAVLINRGHDCVFDQLDGQRDRLGGRLFLIVPQFIETVGTYQPHIHRVDRIDSAAGRYHEQPQTQRPGNFCHSVQRCHISQPQNRKQKRQGSSDRLQQPEITHLKRCTSRQVVLQHPLYCLSEPIRVHNRLR